MNNNLTQDAVDDIADCVTRAQTPEWKSLVCKQFIRHDVIIASQEHEQNLDKAFANGVSNLDEVKTQKVVGKCAFVFAGRSGRVAVYIKKKKKMGWKLLFSVGWITDTPIGLDMESADREWETETGLL